MPQPKLAKARAADATLPPLALRAAIADATHRVVVDAYGKDPYDGASRRCLFSAYVGSLLAQILTGRDYGVVVGSLDVLTTPAADTPDGLACAYAMRVDDPATRGLEFHAWFQGQDTSTQTVTEVVDLTSRYYRTSYEAQMRSPLFWAGPGRPDPRCRWTAPDYPAFIWCQPDDVPAGVRLEGDLAITLAVREQFLMEHGEAVERLTRTALARCPRPGTRSRRKDSRVSARTG